LDNDKDEEEADNDGESEEYDASVHPYLPDEAFGQLNNPSHEFLGDYVFKRNQYTPEEKNN